MAPAVPNGILAVGRSVGGPPDSICATSAAGAIDVFVCAAWRVGTAVGRGPSPASPGRAHPTGDCRMPTCSSASCAARAGAKAGSNPHAAGGGGEGGYMSPELSDVKRREEEKRDAVLGPAERWRLIMEAITWAEAQPQVRRTRRPGAANWSGPSWPPSPQGIPATERAPRLIRNRFPSRRRPTLSPTAKLARNTACRRIRPLPTAGCAAAVLSGKAGGDGGCCDSSRTCAGWKRTR